MIGNITFTGNQLGADGMPAICRRYLVEICRCDECPMPYSATIYSEVGGGPMPQQRIFYAPNWETAFAKLVSALRAAGDNADQTMTVNLRRPGPRIRDK